MTTNTKEDWLTLARLAEQAERYDEMVEAIKCVVLQDPTTEISDEEKGLLSVAYMNKIGQRRRSWKIIYLLEQKEKNEMCTRYRQKLEEEMRGVCVDFLILIEKMISKNDKMSPQTKIFLLQKKGDYYKYLAEYSSGLTRIENTLNIVAAYSDAMDISRTELHPTHPMRLSVALNYSLFFYEILDQRAEAIKVAKDAFNAAIELLDELPEGEYKEAILLMQLLRDNLAVWVSEEEGGMDNLHA